MSWTEKKKKGVLNSLVWGVSEEASVCRNFHFDRIWSFGAPKYSQKFCETNESFCANLNFLTIYWLFSSQAFLPIFFLKMHEKHLKSWSIRFYDRGFEFFWKRSCKGNLRSEIWIAPGFLFVRFRFHSLVWLKFENYFKTSNMVTIRALFPQRSLIPTFLVLLRNCSKNSKTWETKKTSFVKNFKKVLDNSWKIFEFWISSSEKTFH